MEIKGTICHAVLIFWQDNVPLEAKDDVWRRYQTLAEDCGGEKSGILFWQVGKNLDSRKGEGLVEIAIFTDDNALQAFRRHPKHQEFTDILRQIADWKVGDMAGHFHFTNKGDT